MDPIAARFIALNIISILRLTSKLGKDTEARRCGGAAARHLCFQILCFPRKTGGEAWRYVYISIFKLLYIIIYNNYI